MRQTYHIDRLGHQGDGIAPGPFFAPLTLPGEVISAVADGDRLGDIRIETPSDHRVAPPCSHFRACGGCQLMHGSDAFMADWKVGVVVQALAARGITAQVAGLHTSPARSRRRAGLSARRTKKGALAGFHARGSDTIIEVPKCQLLDPALLPALEVAQDLAMTGGSRKGELAVMATATLSGLDISVSGGKPLSRELETDLAAIAEARDLARLAWDGEVVALRRPPYHRFGKALVAPPPGAFLQATMDGEAALRSAVTQIIGDAAQVVDLFAGSGTFALSLAEKAEVLAVEGDKAMIAALDRGWREAQGLKRVRAVARDLFRNPLDPSELTKIDAAVIDPPRAGAEAQVAELAKARIPVIAHVSCNPVSFARDAAQLVQAGYQMGPVTIVDQFRWSSHVEMVAGFSLTSS